MMRLAKRIALSGLASRREAERFILEGRVLVNGSGVQSPALNVQESDEVALDYVPLKPVQQGANATQLWAYHKPARQLVSRSDPAGRRCMMEELQKVGISPAQKPIGRLDFMTEGLMLLTNDGDFARMMEHPGAAIERQYRVRVHGAVTSDKMQAMKRGCTINGVRYKGMQVTVEQRRRGKQEKGPANTWLNITCTEGKNNQIRKICSGLKLTVNRLIRISFGPFKLGRIRAGGVAKLRLNEGFLIQLRRRYTKSIGSTRKEQ